MSELTVNVKCLAADTVLNWDGSTTTTVSLTVSEANRLSKIVKSSAIPVTALKLVAKIYPR